MAKRATPDAGGKRMPLMARITPAVRARLEEAAEKSGRSLAQEVEMRLERSFDLPQIIEMAIERTAAQSTAGIQQVISTVEDHMVSMAGGDDLLMLWSRLSFAVRRAEDDTGQSFRDDENTRNKAERAVLGAVPDLFRNLPPTYSEFKKIASESRTALDALGGLGKLGQGYKDTPTE